MTDYIHVYDSFSSVIYNVCCSVIRVHPTLGEVMTPPPNWETSPPRPLQLSVIFSVFNVFFLICASSMITPPKHSSIPPKFQIPINNPGVVDHWSHTSMLELHITGIRSKGTNWFLLSCYAIMHKLLISSYFNIARE